MGDLVGLVAGSGGITMFATILINLWQGSVESKRQKAIIKKEITEAHVKAMDAAAKRGIGHPVTLIMASLGRFLMLSVTLGMLCFATIYGAHNPNVPVFLSEEGSYSFSIFGITLLDLDLGQHWREFNGVVVLPIWGIIIGASLGYFFGQAAFNRR